MRRLPVISFVFFIIFSAFSMSGCGGGGGSAAPVSLPAYINATLASFPAGSAPANFKSAMVEIRVGSSNGSIVTTATVTMNGTPLIYNAAAGHQVYEGDVIVSPGGTVNLDATVAGKTYTSTSTQFDSYPSIAAPASGITWPASSALSVSWSGGAPTAYAAYVLGVLATSDPNGLLVWPTIPSNVLYVADITTNNYSISANSLTTGDRLLIVGIAKAASIPSAAAKSVMAIIGFNYVPITIN